MTDRECVDRNKGFVTLMVEKLFGKKFMQPIEPGGVHYIVPDKHGNYDFKRMIDD